MSVKLTKQEFEKIKSRGLSYRAAQVINDTFNRENNSIETIIATENPVLTIDWENSDWYSIKVMRQIIIVEQESVVFPEQGQVPFLDSHRHWAGTDAVKGSIRELKIETGEGLRKVIGRTYISSTEEKLIKKIEERHITNVSAGFSYTSESSSRVSPGGKFEYKGRTFENNFGDKLPLNVVTRWSLMEGSAVIWGADEFASFREEDLQNADSYQKRIEQLFEGVNERIEKLNITLSKEIIMEEPKKDQKTPDQIVKEERERSAGIDEIAGALVSQRLYKGGEDELVKAAAKAKTDGISVDQFRQQIWNNLKNEDIAEKPVTDLGLSKNEVKRLSIGRAINAMIEVRGGNLHAWDKFKAGAEKEAIDETVKRVASIPGYELRGLPLPMDFFKDPDVMRHSSVLRAAKRHALKNGDFNFGKRASDGVSAADAQYLIGTENMFNEFIDVLRNLGVAGPWGTRMISGAKQNISVPKKTSTGTFHWVAESGVGIATDFVIGQLTATPHNGWSSMKRTRQAQYQSVPELDALIIDDILNTLIIGRDLALLHGTGADNQPSGIDHTSGIGDVVGQSLDWEALVEFWTDVKTNNINSDNLRYVMNALTAGILMTRPVVAGQIQMLWDRLSQISAPPIISQQAAASNLFYGDGSESWMIDWGVIDLLVNPYKDDTGDVVITAFTALDVLISRATAFSLSDDVS